MTEEHTVTDWEANVRSERGGVNTGRHAQSEKTQGLAADPVYVKGEVFAYVGPPQNLKNLKVVMLKAQQPTPQARCRVRWEGRSVSNTEGYM